MIVENSINKYWWVGASLVFMAVLFFMFLSVLTISTNASAATITVDDDGGADYTKIQDAINASSDGDMVFVKNGVYGGVIYTNPLLENREDITINKRITLIGESKEDTIIRISPGKIGWFEVNADYVTITNLKIEGGWSTNLIGSYNIIKQCNVGNAYIRGSNNVISDATIGTISAGAGSVSVINTTFLSGPTYSILASMADSATFTLINTTFDPNKISLGAGSKLYVTNYLHIVVNRSNSMPFQNASIEIKDNSDVVYTNQTSADGTIQWILATDRVYNGSSTATENTTTLNVSYGAFVFANNDRSIDMSTSHTEYFTNINQAPMLYITSPVDGQNFTYGTTINFNGYAIDVEDGFLASSSISWSSNISGGLATGNISVSNLAVGRHMINITATDSENVVGSRSINITINSPPTATIDSIIPNTMFYTTEVNFAGYGTDTDGTIIAYNWRSNPSGVSSTNASFNLSSVPIGTYTIYFKVMDNNGAWSPEVSSTLIINNNPPTANITAPFKEEMFVLGDAINFSGYGIDVEDGFLPGNSIRWLSSINGTLGYGNISINNPSAGYHTITLVVIDNHGATTNASLNIFINTPPVATISVIEPTFILYRDQINFTGYGNDTDGTIIAYNWSSNTTGNLDSNASFNISSLSIGNYTIYFKVKDNNNTWSTTATANLTIRPLPFDIVVSLLETTTNSNISFNSTVNRSVENYGFEYIWEFGDSTTGNGLTTTHFYSDDGNYTVNLTVKDSNITIASKSILLKVNNVGPTAIAGENTTVLPGSTVQFNGQGTDTDGIIVKYEWDFDGNGVYDWSSIINGLFTYIYNNRGTYNATLRVTDDDGETNTAVRVIFVEPLNHPPVITSMSANRTTITFNDDVILSVSASDEDGDVLAYAYNITGGDLAGTGNTTSWTAPNTTGVYRLSATVSDGKAVSNVYSVNITVLPPNHAPTISVISNQTAYALANFTYQISATDADNDNLTYGADIGTINSTGLFSFTPTATDAYNVTITVNDTKTQTSVSFILAVPNRAPVIVAIPDQNTTVGANYTYQINATDLDGDILTYNASIGSINATDYFIYTPNAAGTYNIIITVNDTKTQNQASFVLTVTNATVNQPPTIAVTSQFTNKVNGTIAIVGTSSDDVFVQKIQLKIDNFGWTDIDVNNSWLYRLDTTTLADGNHTISVRAYDGTLYSAEENITLNVNNEQKDATPKGETKKETNGFVPTISAPVAIATVGALAVAAAFFRRRNNK